MTGLSILKNSAWVAELTNAVFILSSAPRHFFLSFFLMCVQGVYRILFPPFSRSILLVLSSFFPFLSSSFLQSSLMSLSRPLDFVLFFSHFFFFLSLSFSLSLSLFFSYSFFRHFILIFPLPPFLSHFPSSSCIVLSFHFLLRLLFLHIFLPFNFCLNTFHDSFFVWKSHISFRHITRQSRIGRQRALLSPSSPKLLRSFAPSSLLSLTDHQRSRRHHYRCRRVPTYRPSQPLDPPDDDRQHRFPYRHHHVATKDKF
ncbi:unnamed protein product [Acanthosepion pharaonis]|uniref:Transmembrane protein n=1 Tax=Acanthosepion pharaonis TaxID=158019 RepID=A0A812CYW1_ACAPH|nr:unnamed protein product [Sepia pharaonis]